MYEKKERMGFIMKLYIDSNLFIEAENEEEVVSLNKVKGLIIHSKSKYKGIYYIKYGNGFACYKLKKYLLKIRSFYDLSNNVQEFINRFSNEFKTKMRKNRERQKEIQASFEKEKLKLPIEKYDLSEREDVVFDEELIDFSYRKVALIRVFECGEYKDYGIVETSEKVSVDKYIDILSISSVKWIVLRNNIHNRLFNVDTRGIKCKIIDYIFYNKKDFVKDWIKTSEIKKTIELTGEIVSVVVYNNRCDCQKNNHPIEPVRAIVDSIDGFRKCEINIYYCKYCNKYYIHRWMLEEYNKIYGGMLFRYFRQSDFSDYEYGGFEHFNAESLLHLYGYNVKSNCLTNIQRQNILGGIIGNNLMQVCDIVQQINFNINLHPHCAAARIKWLTDLDYLSKYNELKSERTVYAKLENAKYNSIN